MIDITDANFEQEVKQSPLPVLVDFWADWCGPCKMLMPFLHQYDSQYAGKVKIVKVNVENNPNLTTAFDVKSIPTLLFFKNGQLVDTIVGFKPNEINKRLDNF